MTDHSTTTHGSAYAPELRRRAQHLVELAAAIERSLVMSLAVTVDAAPNAGIVPRRERLCDALLQRNLHQLHRAADDLRVTAMRFRTRADELEAAQDAAREAAA